MTLAEYAAAALRTAGTSATDDERQDRLVFALGLTGEAGEVADYTKKVYGHGHTADPAKVRDELGDVLWYVTALAQRWGYTLDEVAAANIAKLQRRYPDGFSSAASKNRTDQP